MDRTERVELTTLVMVRDARGRILLEDRVDAQWGGLCFPGGHIEPGESITMAAAREVREETGLTVSDLRLCGLKQFPISGGRYLVFLFRTDAFSGTLHDSAEGPVGWYDPAEIDQNRVCDNFAQMLSIFDREDLNEMFWELRAGEWELSLL